MRAVPVFPFIFLAGLLRAQTPAATAPPSRPSASPKPAPRPTPAPVLEGTVKSFDGKPLEGALVFHRPLAASYRDLAVSTRTDASGRFRVELKATGPVYLRVEAKGLAGRTLERVDPGTPVTITLDRGRTIEGVVRNSAGEPVRGARVTASPSLGFQVSAWEAREPLVETRTDPRGRFRLEGVGAGLHGLTATARGFGPARKSNVRPGSTENLVLRSGGSIAGVVTDPDGRPVKGAAVRAQKEPTFRPSSRMETTDISGRFEVVGLDPGTYTLVAHQSDYALGVVGGINVEAGGEAGATVALTAGVSLIGRLVSTPGTSPPAAGDEPRPLPGRVSLQELSGRELSRSMVELLHAEAGPDGRFQIPRVPSGSWAVGILARGYAGKRVEVEVSGREAVVDLGDLELESGLAIRGRVRTAQGAPVPDAELSAHQRDMMRGGDVSETRSEADGSFTLAGLSPGAYSVNVQALGFAAFSKELVAGSEGAEIALVPGGGIVGVVVEDGDRPVDAYEIVARPFKAGNLWEGGAHEEVGSAEGRFVLNDLAQDTYVLQVFSPGRAPASVPGVKVVAGRMTDAGLIRLRSGGILRGTVTETTGDPIFGASVRVFGPGQDTMAFSETLQAQTEPSGTFEIRGVPEGKQQVVASHPDHAAAQVDVDVKPAKGPTDARVVLGTGGRIEGIAHKRDGTPLGGLAVQVHSQSQDRINWVERRNPTTQADGSFVIEHVPAGPAGLSLMSPTGSGHSLSTQTKRVDVREGETTTVDFLSREILVSGRITRSGAPLAGLCVVLMGATGMTFMGSAGGDAVSAAPTGPQRLRGSTGEDGSFQLIVDEPGRYMARIESLDGRVHYPVRQLEIPDVESHEFEIAFTGVPVTGLVADKASGQPVPQVMVNAAPKEKGNRGGTSAQTGPDGRFQIEVDPGEYSLGARAENHGIARAEVTVGASGLSDVRLELEKGLEIRGRVVDPAGQGVSGVSILARAGERDYGHASTLPDGSFRMDGLGAFAYNLCAGNQLAGYAVRMGVTPGGDELNLTLRPAGQVRLFVKGPDGSPMAQAWPSVKGMAGAPLEVPFMGGRGPTDARGYTELSTPAGTVDLEIWNEKYKGKTSVSVAEGATVTTEVKLTEPVEKTN